MSILRTIGIFIAIAFGAALILLGYRGIGAWREGKMLQWKADSSAAADTTAARMARAAKLDTVYLTNRAGYIVYRDRVLKSPTATAKDTATFKTCDLVVSSCDSTRAANAATISGLKAELKTARSKPTLQPRRWTLYGEALYGVTGAGPDSVLGAAPVFRGGSEFRLFGPITAKAEGELAMPPAGKSKPMGRALVGIRYVF